MPRSLVTAWLAVLLPVATPDEAAACEALAAELAARLDAYERRAVAILDAIGYAELTAPHEAPDRQQARAVAAQTLLHHVVQLRRVFEAPPSALGLVQAFHHALRIEPSSNEAVIGRWAQRHAEHARQIRQQQDGDKATLRARALKALAKQPGLSQRSLARHLEPDDVEATRKRLARLRLDVWKARTKK